MSARDRILGAIRRNAEGQPARDEAAVATRLSARAPHGPVPAIAQTDGDDRVARFVEQAEAVFASVTRLNAMAELPAALADELRNRNLGPQVRLGDAPEFSDLDWGGIEVSRGAGRMEEPATLSRAIAGVAEVGALAFASGPENPSTLVFLGETHFAVVKRSEVEAGLEGVWRRLRDLGYDPRTINLVTGPSRTGDIEQKLELGAHGPIALHIFLIDDD